MNSSPVSVNRKKVIPQIASALISLSILAVLYNKVAFHPLLELFAQIDIRFCFGIFVTFVMIYVLLAWRWKVMVRPFREITFNRSMQLIVSSSALNIIVPSKLGAFSKIYFMNETDRIETKYGLSAVIYEKLSDLSAMSFIYIIACLFHNRYEALVIAAFVLSIVIISCFIMLHFTNLFRKLSKGWGIRALFPRKLVEFTDVFYSYAQTGSTRKHLVKINSITLLLWMIHTLQFVFFFFALNISLPIALIATYTYCSVFVGLMPVSIAGIGTRDLTIVYLFNGIIDYNKAISIGLLCTLRYILPTLVGLPLFASMVFNKNKHTEPIKRPFK